MGEIAWAWGWAKAPTDKNIAEELSEKLLDALIGAFCDGALGEAVFCLGPNGPWNFGRETVCKIVQDPYFRSQAGLRAVHWEAWHLRRSDFIEWYNRSHLSAGNPPDRFWPDAQSGASQTKGRERLSPQSVKSEAARQVLDSLYPSGMPDAVMFPNKVLCRAAQEHSRRFSFPFTISDTTFLRAAGRRRK